MTPSTVEETTAHPRAGTDLAAGLPGDYSGLREHFRPLFAEIAAGALDRDLRRALPYAEVGRLDRAGFGALRVPAAHGGPGVSLEDFTRLLVDLAEADSNIAHLYRSHHGFVESLRFLPRELQEVWYPRVLAGATVGNASTEKGGNALGTLNTVLSRTPRAGSSPAGSSTPPVPSSATTPASRPPWTAATGAASPSSPRTPRA